MATVLMPPTEFSTFPHLGRQDVHVWSCDLSRHDGDRPSLAALLSIDERNRAARFAFEQHRQRFILSHGLLRVILARYLADEPGRIQFETGPHGKPALRGQSDTAQTIQFSLSHSSDHALVAVAVKRAVGVDVEWCRPEVEGLKLAQRFFAPGESRAISQAESDDQQRLFYRYWTAKEAYLKGKGLGLSLGLDRFELLFGDLSRPAPVRSTESGMLDKDWSVQSFQLADQLVGAIAVEGEAWNVQLLDATAALVR